MLEFKLYKIMATIFTPEFSITNTYNLVSTFQTLSNNRFDGELISMPVPPDAPSQIPRLNLKSKNGTWQLEVSLERTNLIFFKPVNLSVPMPSLFEFSEIAGNIFRAYKGKTKIVIQRLALITERYAVIKENTPSQFLATKFCKNEYMKQPFNRTSAFEIHSLKKYEFNKFNLNSWIRLKTNNLANEQRTPVLTMTNDINTYASNEDPGVKFTQKDLTRFFSSIPEHLESIINLYFN